MRTPLNLVFVIGLGLATLVACQGGHSGAPLLPATSQSAGQSGAEIAEPDGPVHQHHLHPHTGSYGAGVIVLAGSSTSWGVPVDFCGYDGGIACGWVAWFPGFCAGGNSSVVPDTTENLTVTANGGVGVLGNCYVAGVAQFTATASKGAAAGDDGEAFVLWSAQQCFIDPATGHLTCNGIGGIAAWGFAMVEGLPPVPSQSPAPPIPPQTAPPNPAPGCGSGNSRRDRLHAHASGQGGGGCPSPGPTLLIYELNVTDPVSDGNAHNSVIGKQMVLTAQFPSPQPQGPFQWTWSIGGVIVKDYQLFTGDQYVQPGQPPVPYSPPSPQTNNGSESTSFYWVAGVAPGGTPVPITVTALSNSGNEQSSATALYNVEAPQSVSISTLTNPPTVGKRYRREEPSRPFLSLGTQWRLPNSAGVYTTAAAAAPQDYGGDFSLTQTINFTTILTFQNGLIPPQITGTGGATDLDGCALLTTPPSGDGGGVNVSFGAGQPVNYQTIDAPADPLDDPPGQATATAENSFLTYFMFHPHVPGSAIWVPLGYYPWVYNAEAVLGGAQGDEWMLVNPVLNPNPIVGTVFSAEAPPSFPQWTSVFQPPSYCEIPPKPNIVRKPARAARTSLKTAGGATP